MTSARKSGAAAGVNESERTIWAWWGQQQRPADRTADSRRTTAAPATVPSTTSSERSRHRHRAAGAGQSGYGCAAEDEGATVEQPGVPHVLVWAGHPSPLQNHLHAANLALAWLPSCACSTSAALAGPTRRSTQLWWRRTERLEECSVTHLPAAIRADCSMHIAAFAGDAAARCWEPCSYSALDPAVLHSTQLSCTRAASSARHSNLEPAAIRAATKRAKAPQL